MRKRPSIGRAEMEVLRHISDHHPVTVRQVADHFGATKGYVRTTVLNVMERLREKGYLVRRKAGGVFEYSPQVPTQQLLRALVGDFVQRTLGGSVSPFVTYLVEDAELSEPEVTALRNLLQQLEAKTGAREP
jgi:predicted transcriptional regulator